MSKQEQEKTTAQNASSVIYIGDLPDGNFYVGTEPPADGFATDAGETVMEEFQELAVEEQPVIEQQNPLSMLPQNKRGCYLHPMWNLSKKCVACGEPEFGGAVTSNERLFMLFGCRFIRACPKHHAMVSAHFAKQEFNEPIDNPSGLYLEIRRCGGCGKNFSTMCDSQNSFCDKGCQGNWLDRY
jgi:hypothetical protein